MQLEYIRPSGGHANRGYTYQVTYWDNYQSLRERIRRSLEEQVKALKAGTPATEMPESGTLRNAHWNAGTCINTEKTAWRSVFQESVQAPFYNTSTID